MADEEVCAACKHPWAEHSKDEGCWNGWAHDTDGYVVTSGCECFLAHARLSRRGVRR